MESRSITTISFPAPVVIACAALVVLSSCGTGIPVDRETGQADAGVPESRYSIVCVIHGDGDYLYHDTSGVEYSADEEALAEMRRVAERNPLAEVFIFHQQPRKHLLFLFPLPDGDFFYYRNGRLIAEESYWRDPGEEQGDAELELVRRFRRADQDGGKNVFLYFGHEIPESGGAGYSASYPDRAFTVDDLAKKLQGFAGDSARFDLVVLSTCFGGTPYTVGTLGEFGRTIVASPENLHLSYFPLDALERLDLQWRDGDASALAGEFARQAFDRLTGELQTAVSVAVYDADRTREYLRSVRGVTDRILAAVKGETQGAVASLDRCDCAEIPGYVLPTMNEGVRVLYRPARFGRSKDKLRHSGWECWKGRGPDSR